MEYGTRKYREKQQLAIPNIIIDRDNVGDYFVKSNAEELDPWHDSSESIVGDDEIAAYVESALERFENDNDVQAGLIAITILHQFASRYGEVPAEICHTISEKVLEIATHTDSLLFTIALESHPVIASDIRHYMHTLAVGHSSFSTAASDPRIRNYLSALTGEGDINMQVQEFAKLLQP